MLILIPFPLFFASTIYGVRGLTAWVVIGIIWCFCSTFTVVLYPLWESRVAIGQIARGLTKVRFFEFLRHCIILTCFFSRKDIFAFGSGKHVAIAPSSGA
jgi:hypothetical protein